MGLSMFDDFMDFFFMKLVMPIMLILAVLLVCSIPFLIYEHYQDSKKPTFELKKSEWSCSKDHKEVRVHHILVGKIMVPQYHTQTICDQWSRL